MYYITIESDVIPSEIPLHVNMNIYSMNIFEPAMRVPLTLKLDENGKLTDLDLYSTCMNLSTIL